LKDPDGVIIKLVGTDAVEGGTPWILRGVEGEDAIIALRGATLLSEHPAKTTDFLARHGGFMPADTAGSITRMTSQSGQVLDIRDATGFWPAAPGTGAIDHVALRLPDVAAVDAEVTALAGEEIDAVNVHDRKYFYSLYVREPAGCLIELATDDGPGFAVDEAPDMLGTTLFIPDHFRLRREDIVPMLPQFGLPGEPRILYRDLPFVHRIHEADAADGQALVLLHGTGGNEASLLPLGRKMLPDATLIGLRGRATEEGVARFFRRFGPLEFDQADIRAETEALAAFIEQAAFAYGLAQDKTAFLGYSNGANLLAAAIQLHPGLIRRAVLLRPMPVLDEVPVVNLSGTDILIVAGAEDPYRDHSTRLAEQLRVMGAQVELTIVSADHELSGEDEAVARAFLR
ncbi:MAG: ring-cleaving dioxygenase, partial [Rhizobium sp.]|nr:ring-cleaving dioxygenase [Rhizobium sp.]